VSDASWKVYMLRCRDGTLYTGATNDLERRLATHNRGKGAAYTRARLPVTLVWSESAADRGAALRREAALKRLTRAEKLRLVRRVRG
jgi:putative endonuclease